MKKYLDFDLLIEPNGEGYTARVFSSPGGQASSDFVAPFSDLELENFLLRVGRTRHTVRRIESPEMATAKAFGGRLFNGVFAGDVRGCLRSSMDEASRQGAGLRVRLHLSKVPALADLPWEFLYNSGMNRFLSLSVETPLVRFLELPERIRPVAVTPPLRVLLMISSPTDYPKLDVERESAKITEALADLEQRGLVIVERQETATLAELQRRLRQHDYHIFHFVGHGGFDEQAQDGLLILEDQEERGRRVSAQFLGTLLHDHRALRLAVLNACEGARASRTDPFAGTAQSLVQQGIPAVIAMQFEVTDEAAICFTREFYSSIASGYPVDAALAEARKAIFAEVSEIEWGTPVLYMRAPDGRIFDIEQVSETERRRLQLLSLLEASRAAEAAGDLVTAREKVTQALALDAGHAESAQRLQALREMQAPPLPLSPPPQPVIGPQPGGVVPVRGSASHPVKWMFVGGTVGVAAVIALVVLVVIGLALDDSKSSNAGSPDDPAIGGVLADGPADAPEPPPADEPARPAPKPPTPAPAAATVTPALQQAFVNLIDRGDAAAIEAFRTLNAAPLYEMFTGPQLQSHLAAIAQLQAQSVFMVSTRHAQQFLDFAISPDGQGAQVRLVERWSFNFFSRFLPNVCANHWHERDIPQTMHLQLMNGRWLIANIDQSNVPPPQEAPCH